MEGFRCAFDDVDPEEVAAISTALSRYLSEDGADDEVDPWVMSGRYLVAGLDEVRTPSSVQDLDEWVLVGRADRF